MLGAGLHGTLWPVVNVARGLDHVFFGAFRDAVVKGPVFVVATPRSGTTFLHHLLALDENRFTHLLLYQTVFPSVLVDELVSLLARIEQTYGLPLSTPVRWLNERMFRNWDGIHQVGLDAEEEDESLFVYALATPALFLLWPFVDACPELQNIDQLPPAVRQKIARDYRATMQRHVHVHGKTRTGRERLLLIKNVLLPSRIETTKMAFPDAKFIRLVRDPIEAIPSAMSLFTAQWAVHSPEIPKCSRETRALGEMFIDHYRRLAEYGERASPGSFVTVRFEDLVRDPVAVIEDIYAFFGWEVTDDYREALRKELSRPSPFKSRHGYDLADYGWDPEDVRHELQDLLGPLGYASVQDPARPSSGMPASARHVAPTAGQKDESLAVSGQPTPNGAQIPPTTSPKDVAEAPGAAYGHVK